MRTRGRPGSRAATSPRRWTGSGAGSAMGRSRSAARGWLGRGFLRERGEPLERMRRAMPPDYVPLACHSWYSLLRGVDPVESLCEAADRMGAKALALTDVNALYGALPFWEAARDAGLAPLIGADIQTAPPPGPTAAGASGPRAILLATGARGYRRLCRVITESHRDDYGVAPAPFHLRDLLLA